jgi:hypothetical protein
MELLFHKHDLNTAIAGAYRGSRERVENLSDNYLLAASETDLADHIADSFKFDVPTLGDPFVEEHSEVNIEVQRQHWADQTHFKGERVSIRIPFDGDRELFFYRPSHYDFNPPSAAVYDDHLGIEIVRAGLTAEIVQARLKETRGAIEKYLQTIRADVQKFHEQLPVAILGTIQERKQRILRRQNMVASLGLPIARRDSSPATFALPIKRQRIRISAPVVTDGPFRPEPELAAEEYENILRIMRSMVQVMERSPSEFSHLTETGLRSHFLVQLNGQYEGSATGETFNYQGKSDILIRAGDRNVFIAECKFWTGKKCIAETIDQILGYLHWRDTKAAVVLFNRNKDFTNVLSQVVPTVEAHACWKRTIGKESETEWRFLFRNRDDANREIHLAFLAFDVPNP